MQEKVNDKKVVLEKLAKNYLKVAAELVKECNAVDIYYSSYRGGYSVQMLYEDFLKLFSAEEIHYVERGCPDYPYEARIKIGGITFFALLKKGEYRKEGDAA